MEVTDGLNAPATDEIEISIFGPGYGECILIHVGNGDWVTVDSCIDPHSKAPASLEYLRGIGFNPAICVKSIIATHWHDDHIRGLAQVFHECESADFCCSDALKDSEFLPLITTYGEGSPRLSSGVQEFHKILMTKKARAEESGTSASPKWAIADRPLWKKKADLQCEICALSPSDTSVLMSKQQIAQLIPASGVPKRRVVPISPNHFAVVLWIQIESTSILLGSDLQETGDPQTGWTVILNSNSRPSGKASVFKVPHHGSENADSPRIWSEMLKEPIAVITPFSKAGKKLPTEKDTKRICDQAKEVYQTSTLRAKKVRKPKIVEQLLKGAVRSIQPVDTSFGHVRLRLAAGADRWTVDLFGDAVALKSPIASVTTSS